MPLGSYPRTFILTFMLSTSIKPREETGTAFRYSKSQELQSWEGVEGQTECGLVVCYHTTLSIIKLHFQTGGNFSCQIAEAEVRQLAQNKVQCLVRCWGDV